MKKRSIFYLVLIYVLISVNSTSADTIFRSSFETPVQMSDWIHGTNWYKETTGADKGYDWETDLISTSSFWNIILNSATYPNPDECIGLDLTEDQAHTGNRSLYMKVFRQCKYNSVQARVAHNLGEQWPYEEAHIKYWLKFPADLESRFSGGGVLLNEVRLSDFRIAFEVTSANGPLQFRAWAEPTSSGWDPLWVVYSDEPVPVGEWFHVEIYTNWRTYAEGGGAYWIKINGKKIIEVIPTATKRICGDSVSSQTCSLPYNWNMIKLYTYTDNIEAWMDDFELYDTYTPDSMAETYCGDSDCAADEDCSTCPSDCGQCPLNERYTILKTGSPPVIDGSITEFSDVDPITVTDSIGTVGTYKILWDSDALYFAAQFSDTKLDADLSHQEDDGIYSDDCLEIMFDTLNDGGDIQGDDYKFFVNVNNIHSDSQRYDVGWDSGMVSYVAVDGTINNDADSDSGYVIEARIPWSEWTTPADEDIWGMNIQLNDKTESGSTQAQWSDEGFSVNQPEGWKDVVFSSEKITGSLCGDTDTNQNDIVEIGELISYISMWKSGNVTIGDLIAAIGKWKSGC